MSIRIARVIAAAIVSGLIPNRASATQPTGIERVVETLRAGFISVFKAEDMVIKMSKNPNQDALRKIMIWLRETRILESVIRTSKVSKVKMWS